jgi:lysophospholipase L1-like esterase
VKRWSARGPVAAFCVLLLLLAGLPGRAVAAPPPTESSTGAISISAARTHVTLTMNLGVFDVVQLRNWVREIKVAYPILSDALKNDLRTYRLDPPILTGEKDWVDFDGDLTVTSTGLTLDMSGPDIRAAASWWVRAIAGGVSMMAALGLRVLCYGFFNVGAALAGPICGALYGFFGSFLYNVIILFVDGQQGDWKAWGKALAWGIVGAVGPTIWESGLNKFAKEQMRPLMLEFAKKLKDLATAVKKFVKTLGAVISQVADGTVGLANFLPDAMMSAARGLFRPSDWPARIRVMVVGDSMTEGHEGDWTWRYWLWKWFRDSDIDVDFVGPYHGTMAPPSPAPPARPPLQGTVPVDAVPSTTGSYAAGAQPFDSDHFAMWGRQAAQAKTLIREQVQIYQPDLILVGLGFNDMGWFISDAPGTLASMRSFIDEARAAKPGVDFAVANVPQRTHIGGRDDLPVKTDQYNRLLGDAIPTWSTTRSRVELVDWRGAYHCEPTSCPAGYDGLHPNLLGEYEIAQAYETTLHDRYLLGDGVPPIPLVIPVRPTPVPSDVQAASSPLGVTVTWAPVFGAFNYDVRYRRKGDTTWAQQPVQANRFDTTWTADGDQWEYQIRTSNGDNVKSDWSPIVGATAHPQTAPPPVGIIASSTGTGIYVVWGAPTGPYTDTIERYGVLVLDLDTPGAIVQAIGIKGLSAHIDGLVRGHHYLVAVTTWNAVGGGLPGVAGIVVV